MLSDQERVEEERVELLSKQINLDSVASKKLTKETNVVSTSTKLASDVASHSQKEKICVICQHVLKQSNFDKCV